MVILIGNQKGGAGKSTFCLLLANYLTTVQERVVTVLDMDYQQSLATKFEKAKILENQPLYEVVAAELHQFPALQKVFSKKPEELVLIDLPGKMDDDGLIPVFAAGELFICPFGYDEFSVDSTVLFAMVLRKINNLAPMLFIPNRIKATVRYDTRTEIEQALRRFGVILPGLPDRIDFQRISTYQTPIALMPVVLSLMHIIYEHYISKAEDRP